MKKLSINDFHAVIFDLDGTLVDSMGMWAKIDVEYLARFGLACPEDLQRRVEGLSFNETAVYFKDFFGLTDSVEKIRNDWLAMSEDQYCHFVELKPGVPEFLSFLSKSGIKAAIASSNHYALIESCLKAHGIFSFFQAIITCDDVCANKPDPSVYLCAAEKLNEKPEDCLVFEDIPFGVLAGKNAGMTVCAVEDTYSAPVFDEKKELSDAVISDYREMIPEESPFL